MQVYYSAEDVPAGLPPAVSEFLQDQLRKISAALTEPDVYNFQKTNIAPTKPQSGDIRFADGTNWNPGAGAGLYLFDTVWTPIDRNLARTSNLVEVVNTIIETTVFTQSIYAGLLSTNKGVRLSLIGDYLNNTGSTQDVTFRVKFGTTTLLTFVLYDGLGGISTSATRRTILLDAILANINSDSIQFASGIVHTSAGSSVPAQGSGAENTANALNLTVTAEHTTASANASFRMQFAHLELL